MFAGLSFIHAGFLAAGAAIALPVVIHLLFRQRTRTMTIGSIRFLQQVARDHRKRQRLRQWLLLAVRCLATLLLALLFARPYIDQWGLASLQQELVLLVDRSASLATQDHQGQTAFAKALHAAQSVLAPLDENVVVHVGLCDAAGIEEISASRLAEPLLPSEAATDHGLAISWARDLVMASQRKERRVVLVTDLQRSGLRDRVLEQLPEGTRFDLHDVGQPVSENVTITSVQMLRTEIRPQMPIAVRVILQNFSPAQVSQVPLEVRLRGPDGAELQAQQRADLAGGGTAVLDIPLEVTVAGLYQGQVQITCEDRATWDNARWLAFEARHPDRVLLVDGDPGRTVFSSETYFLETALRLPPTEGATFQRSFEVEKLVWDAGEGFPDLTGFRALLLANLRRYSATDIQRLADYVRAGGGVLIFAGDQSNPVHLDALREAGVFPGRIAREPVTSTRRVTSWPKSHPTLAPFSDPQQGDLRRIEFRRVWPLEELSPDATTLLQAGSFRLAAERTLGQGRCIYFGSTADREWNQWPQSRLFVPLVRQWTGYLTGQLAEQATVVNEWITKADERAGIAQTDGRLIVRNIDPRESIPDRLPADDFRANLGVPDENVSPEEQARRASIALPPNALRPDEHWTWILWTLLAVLAIETLLASRVHA